MAKTINGAIGFVSGTTPTANYIKQIDDGKTIHDIAVEHGITFFNGSSEIIWDGKQPVEVVIPTLADIVTDPVVFAGTVGDNGEITWAKGYSGPARGYLVYIQKNCTFGGQTCEPGDMAVYDGDVWQVIQGENQVAIVPAASEGNADVLLTGTLASVLKVEGTDLRLAIDYADVRSKISVSLNADNILTVKGGKVNVSSKSINLSQVSGTTTDITTAVSIDLPTALESGAVTISENVLSADDFTFVSGSFPTISKNANAITINASHNMTVVATSDSGSFVTGVEAIKSVAFNDTIAGDAAIAYVSGINRTPGTSFVSGIHAHTTEDADKTPDFTVAGVVTAPAESNTFATGFTKASTSGDVVSAVTVGAVTGEFVTGLSGGSKSVVTGVTFGDVVEDTKEWFVTGLADNAKAVTGVDFGSVNVTPQTSSAVVSASVNNHVLSFNTGNFMTSATAALSGTGVTTKAFTKGGVKLTGFEKASDTLKTGSVSQAETTISYKSLKTGAVTLTQGTTGFHFDKEKSAAYSPIMGYKKVNVTAADVSKAGAVLQNTAITANISAGAVAVDLNAGTLPSLTIATPSGTLSGTVGTELSKDHMDWLAVASDKKMIAGATTWSLVESSDAAEGSIGFAKAGTYDVNGDTVIEKDSFIAAVKVSSTPVPTTPGA